MIALNSFSTIFQTANIRKKLDFSDLFLSEGIGNEGDMVLGEVIPTKDKLVKILDEKRVLHIFDKPTLVLAVLGNRESSTHTNGGVPEGGLQIKEGELLAWLSGESGMVGKLFYESIEKTGLPIETSLEFRCKGLIYRNNKKLNIAELISTPQSKIVQTPILLIGASSAEAGKTTLATKLIKHLCQKGIKVAAIKVTGTGGIMDSQKHQEAGAFWTADQVEAGLITTYTSPEKFKHQIPNLFLLAQDQEPDLIVAELGGDIIWANNPSLFSISELMRHVIDFWVIANDMLSGLGIKHFLQSYPTLYQKLTLFASPFRNFEGMRKRAITLGIGKIENPNGNMEELVKIYVKSLKNQQ